MKSSVTLTPENVSKLARVIELTGLSLREVVNNLLADELQNFQPDDDSYDYVENTLGCRKFKDRVAADEPLNGSKDASAKVTKASFRS
jgi:hypothetical protein